MEEAWCGWTEDNEGSYQRKDLQTNGGLTFLGQLSVSISLSAFPEFCTLSVLSPLPQHCRMSPPVTSSAVFPVHNGKIFSYFSSGTHQCDPGFYLLCLFWHIPAPASLPGNTFRSLFQRNYWWPELLACASSLPLHTSHLLKPFNLDSSASLLNLLSWRSQIQWSFFRFSHLYY